jgi:chemotaxis protein MotB
VTTEDALVRDGAGATERFPAPLDDNAGLARKAEENGRKALKEIQETIDGEVAEKLSDALAEHIRTRMTPDGLLIELIDRDSEPLFAVGSAEPSPLLAELVAVVAPVLATAANTMSVIGHTDARAYNRARAYSNWELSTDRANAARRLLVADGFPEAQIASVSGKADTEPFSDDPLAAQNRRIAIILLTPRSQTSDISR